MPGYRLSKRAAEDLDEVLAFTIERWSAVQAEEYLRSLEVLFDTLVLQPRIGRIAATVRPDLRRLEHMSHVIFYRELTTGIRIERILHKSQALKSNALT